MPSKIVRDPLWNNIRLDPLSLELIDTPAFQRLRYVRQLGLASSFSQSPNPSAWNAEPSQGASV